MYVYYTLRFYEDLVGTRNMFNASFIVQAYCSGTEYNV